MSGSDSNKFYKDGYKIVPKLINTEHLYKYALGEVKTGAGNKDDKQAPGSPSFYKDQVMQKLHKDILSLIEEHTGLKLFPTYTYWRMYQKDTILYHHTDRPACEISVTLCLGQELEADWPLYLLNRNEEPIMVNQQPGDALFYRGCELLHWRPKFKGKTQAQVFLHYVDQFGPHKEHKFDQLNQPSN